MQLSASSHVSATLVQPSLESQMSAVHELPSLQSTGVLPQSPEIGSHELSVQASPSSQVTSVEIQPLLSTSLARILAKRLRTRPAAETRVARLTELR